MKKLLISLLLLFPVIAFSQNFKFAVLTDLHVVEKNQSPLIDLQRSVEQINNTDDLAFVLVTGDLTDNGDRASILKVKDALDKLKYKYYIVSGNHETKWSESGSTDFGHIFGSENFQFEYDGVRFLGFATGPVIRMMDGHVAPQDVKWLKEELSKSPDQPTILVTHYPLLPQDVDNWYEVTDAVRGFDIKTFIGGHYHSNRQFFYDGIPGFICRSNLRDKTDGIGGYTLMEVRSDSIIASECKIGTDPCQWGAFSMKRGVYYTADNSKYDRPDFSMNKTYSGVQQIWMTVNGNSIYSSPVLFKGNVYVADDAGYLNCYGLKDGSKKWNFKTENRIIGTPAVDKGVVVFGSADKNIYGIDAVSGKQLWKITSEEAVLGAVTIEKGIAYIGDSNHTMHAIDIKTGKHVWQYKDVVGYIETRPLVYLDKVVFGAWDEYMYAVDKKTGNLAWKWKGDRPGMLYSPAAVWPVGAHGKIFFSAPDRVLTAIDANTGETVWRTNESMVRETVGLSEDQQRIYSKTMQDSVVCYSTIGDAPNRLWSINVGYGYDHAPSMPVEKDGVVFGSTKNGEIFAIEGKSGKLLWRHKIGNSIISTVYPLSATECLFTSGEGIVGLLRYKK